MSASAHAVGAPAQDRLRLRSSVSGWSACAWGAIGVTATFIALTCWWLTQDRSIPIYDAGLHLKTAIIYHGMLSSGDLLGPFNNDLTYPPLAYLVGAFAMFIGGVNVFTAVSAENLVFVPLLALGCYQTGRLLFDDRAGLLAVIFVLGSPLMTGQLHVFALDAPETAMVALSMWLLLASEDFGRRRMAAWAGLAVGLGLLLKVTFPLFLAGIFFAALIRGGWRNWRNLAIFTAVALVIGTPWYLDHIPQWGKILTLAGTSSGAVPGNLPSTFSTDNLLWYFWSTLNSQLLAPLFLLVLGGTAWMIYDQVRGSDRRGLRLELLLGGFVAWLAISLTPHHDIRYDMPLMPYLAVVGTGWIIALPRAARLAATAVLVLAVAANTLGTTFGVGSQVETTLVQSPPATEALPERIVFYANQGGLGVAGPRRDGDLPGLLRALRRTGVRGVAWSRAQTREPDFSSEGLIPLALIAGLRYAKSLEPVESNPAVVGLIHAPVTPRTPPTCTQLSDGTGVWVLRGNLATRTLEFYCPFPYPHFYPA
jgi:4-amino-4-deoxy-L-arabinose transferase-like glycosyltransferase